MIKYLLLCTVFLSSFGVKAQENTQQNSFVIFGVILEEDSKKPISDAALYIVSQGDTLETVAVAENGKFECTQFYNLQFDLHFTHKGSVTKIVAMDTRNVPDAVQQESFGFDLDISLFKAKRKKDYSLFNEPIALAMYEAKEKSLTFNNDYTRKQQALIKAFQQ